MIMLDNPNYEILNSEILYEGVFRLTRYHLRFKLFNGGMSKIICRELFERKSAAAVLPYDPVLDKVILIEQFRVGAIQRNENPWLIEIVAGILDTEESPAEVAIREAQEEANCNILHLYPICEYFVSPGGSNEYLSVFCGCIDSTKAGGIYGLHEEDEDIRTHVLSFAEAYQELELGKIKTSPAIVSLQWLKLHREWLRNLWQKK